MGIDAGVELSASAFCVASRHYMATYCAALRFSPQIVMRGDRDSFVMLAGTWGGKGNVRCGQERQAPHRYKNTVANAVCVPRWRSPRWGAS